MTSRPSLYPMFLFFGPSIKLQQLFVLCRIFECQSLSHKHVSYTRIWSHSQRDRSDLLWEYGGIRAHCQAIPSLYSCSESSGPFPAVSQTGFLQVSNSPPFRTFISRRSWRVECLHFHGLMSLFADDVVLLTYLKDLLQLAPGSQLSVKRREWLRVRGDWWRDRCLQRLRCCTALLWWSERWAWKQNLLIYFSSYVSM